MKLESRHGFCCLEVLVRKFRAHESDFRRDGRCRRKCGYSTLQRQTLTFNHTIRQGITERTCKNTKVMDGREKILNVP